MQQLRWTPFGKPEMVWCIEGDQLHQLAKAIHTHVLDHLVAWEKVDQQSHFRWKPPDPGWLKINTDVAFRDHGSFTALSCRDNISSLCNVSMECIDV